MKILSLLLISASALAADLKPNAQLTFDFPELPNTLPGMVSGTMKVARLGAILPAIMPSNGRKSRPTGAAVRSSAISPRPRAPSNPPANRTA